MKLIEHRVRVRAEGDFNEERRLHKLVKDSAKNDRREWLEGLKGIMEGSAGLEAIVEYKTRPDAERTW